MSGRRSSVRWRERSVLVRALRLWRTRNPRTFRDKVRYKMLRDHRALMVTFADKAAVRGYVAAVVGERYLPRVYAILDDPAALADVRLPAAYVVKPTHGSGAAIVVSDRAPREAVCRPSSVAGCIRTSDLRRRRPLSSIRIAAGWATQLYGQGPNREWVYGHRHPHARFMHRESDQLGTGGARPRTTSPPGGRSRAGACTSPSSR